MKQEKANEKEIDDADVKFAVKATDQIFDAPKITIFSCKVCGAKLRDAEAKIEHKLRCTDATFRGAVFFECSICNKAFTFRANVIRHVEEKHLGRVYLCNVCGNKVTCKYKHRNQQRRCINAVFTDVYSNDKSEDVKNHRPLKKEICPDAKSNIVSKRVNDGNGRSRERGAAGRRKKVVTVKKHICKVCTKRFSHSTSLKSHIEDVHNGRVFQCKLCKKNIRGTSNSFKHKINSCPKASFSVYFESDRQKKSISNRQPRGKKHTKLKCKFCDKYLLNKYILKSHVEDIHKGRVFTCNKCGNKFEGKWRRSMHKHRGGTTFVVSYEPKESRVQDEVVQSQKVDKVFKESSRPTSLLFPRVSLERISFDAKQSQQSENRNLRSKKAEGDLIVKRRLRSRNASQSSGSETTPFSVRPVRSSHRSVRSLSVQSLPVRPGASVNATDIDFSKENEEESEIKSRSIEDFDGVVADMDIPLPKVEGIAGDGCEDNSPMKEHHVTNSDKSKSTAAMKMINDLLKSTTSVKKQVKASKSLATTESNDPTGSVINNDDEDVGVIDNFNNSTSLPSFKTPVIINVSSMAEQGVTQHRSHFNSVRLTEAPQPSPPDILLQQQQNQFWKQMQEFFTGSAFNFSPPSQRSPAASSIPSNGLEINENCGNNFTENTSDVCVKREPVSSRTCCMCVSSIEHDEVFRCHLLRHLEPFEGKTVCPVCHVHCGSNKRMADHFMASHGELEKSVCRFHDCVRAFWTTRARDTHEKSHQN